MSSFQYQAATHPKDLRAKYQTPESDNMGDEQLVIQPTRPRFRLKKRDASNSSSHLRLRAPSKQFLDDCAAAAADMPLPSIETPDCAGAYTTPDEIMVDSLPTLHLQDDDALSLYPIRMRTPQTPAVDLAPSTKAAKFPNWSIESPWSDSELESSPEYESSRPSTAFSTQTSSSLFSQFSHPSEDGDCISPDVDSGYFNFSDLPKSNEDSSSRVPRKAPWTKAMSSHLWSTYMLYLQDSTVTPVNMGKSCIPPNGVCARVAREARRSWKGSKQMLANNKSGSNTPTAESSRPYMEWPHTCAATRAHLRELCKLRAAPSRQQHGRALNMSQSPAPFNKAAHKRWNRRSTPARSPSVFSAQDMSMSLALSTSETMQPQGPMALLTSSEAEPQSTFEAWRRTSDLKNDAKVDSDPFVDHGSPASRMRLGSPFAKSYGPSSSSSKLAQSMTEPSRRAQTERPRKFLMSPARLTRSQSGTQKRRSLKTSDQPRKRRPSLATALWGPPTDSTDSSYDVSVGTQFSSTDSCESDKLFIPRTTTTDTFPQSATGLYEPAMQAPLMSPSLPARLGSPFSFSYTSHSFPNRRTQPINFNLSALRKPFATVQQPRQSSPETSPTRTSLSSRLAYFDQRLKGLRNRSSRTRSQSPSV